MNPGIWDISQDMNLENINKVQQIEEYPENNSWMNITIMSITDQNYLHQIGHMQMK